MTPSNIALTALTDQIRIDELAWVAAALQTQVTRDFAPIWGVNAVIAAVSFEAIPAGYVPVIVRDMQEAEGVDGFHRTRGDETSYIVVPGGPNWSLAASHELLRMLANPTGSARRPGAPRMSGQGTVEYLIDVCAPCQDVAAAYAIDGVTVSDFCTPRFFDATGSACSFAGSLREPLAPAAGGIVTWLADDALLYQARADHHGRVRVYGGFPLASPERMLFRERVDLLTPDRLTRLSNAPRTAFLMEAEQNARRSRFTNMTRFGDDIAARFRLGCRPEAEPRREIIRSKIHPADATRWGQKRAGAGVVTTLRTVS